MDAFWCAQLNTFPQLAKKALEILVPFATTYLCETGFSTFVNIKTKQKNRLDPRDDTRVSISKKEPRFNMIIDEKHRQKAISKLTDCWCAVNIVELTRMFLMHASNTQVINALSLIPISTILFISVGHCRQWVRENFMKAKRVRALKWLRNTDLA